MVPNAPFYRQLPRYQSQQMIRIENLKKRYGQTTACDIPSLTISNGEIIGFVGNNGAGKTTLFRLMLDLVRPDSGGITMFPAGNKTYKEAGINISGSEDWKQFTGAYLDESFLIDFLTTDEYFSFLGATAGLSRQETEERLSRFESFANGEIFGNNKLIRELSAGNRQKTGIMAALITAPETVILDEPFNFLDPKSQNILKRTLSEYSKTAGATILVSSHNLSHTIDISTRIILLEGGRIIRDIPNNDDSAARELENYFNADCPI